MRELGVPLADIVKRLTYVRPADAPALGELEALLGRRVRPGGARRVTDALGLLGRKGRRQ